jgi:GT2 family glycosyltransferase
MKLIEINTDQMETPKPGENLMETRKMMADLQPESAIEVSIIILAYNRLEKTRRCVESILKYTQGINYELILLDNGSSDGTLEYFCSIPYEQKTVIHFTKNMQFNYPQLFCDPGRFGRYVCFVCNDMILTENWLSNMLTCIKSDPRIGMVNPLSNSVANLQKLELPYHNYEELQELASKFNHSDPRKWEDRIKLVVLSTLWRKEVLYAAGWPLFDLGFYHDGNEYDLTFRVRRAGYRTVLAGDTWVCHDHKVVTGEERDLTEYQASLEAGRNNFKEKHYGINFRADVNNFFIPHLEHLPAPPPISQAKILGVDVRCGSPILDIKNWMRRYDIYDVELSAFVQDPKYWLDLKTICAGDVVCDREEFLADDFSPESFDYVMADRPVNCYHEPEKVIGSLFQLCKKGGTVICKLKNPHSYRAYLHWMGRPALDDTEPTREVPLERLRQEIGKNAATVKTVPVPFKVGKVCAYHSAEVDAGQRDAMREVLPKHLSAEQQEKFLDELMCKEYLIIAEKH